MSAAVRRAQSRDLVEVRIVECLAGERFCDVGLESVAEDGADQAVGYILLDVVDGISHIEQVTVRPDWQGRGVGRSLIWAAAAGAADRAGLPHSLTLSTFDRVPWNRPLFGDLDFRVLVEGDIGEELRRVRLAEASRGLDPATRVLMRLDYGGLGVKPALGG